MRRGERGLTLIEVAIASVILSLIILAGLPKMDAHTDAQHYLAGTALQNGRVDRVLDRIVEILEQASVSTLADVPDAPSTSNSIRFSRPASHSLAGGVVLGAEERIHSAAGEILFVTASGTVPLIEGAASVTFSREGRVVHIEVATEVPGPKGMPVNVTRRTSVYCRN